MKQKFSDASGNKRLIFPAHICTVCVLVIMFGLYPFYMKGGYYGIDDAKYAFLWNLYRIGLPVIAASAVIQSLIYKVPKQIKSRLSQTDIWVLVYAVSTCISAIFAVDKHIAWYGQNGWYIGGFIILLLCGLYFAISRFWRDDRITIGVMLFASAIVFVLGVLNRFSIWPFAIPGSFMNYGFISTLGNIGWYNGYISVIATVGIALFVIKPAQTKVEHIALGIYTWIVFMTALSQGGDTIFLYFLALFTGLLVLCAICKTGYTRWLEVLIIWAASGQILHLMRNIDDEWYNYVSDNLVNLFNNKFTTLWVLIPALAVYILWINKDRRTKATGEKKNMTTEFCVADGIKKNDFLNSLARKLPILMIAIILIWLILALVYTFFIGEAPKVTAGGETPIGLFIRRLLYLSWDWGSGRGATIGAGAKIYGALPWYRKLIGIGPDCFSVGISASPDLALALRAKLGDATLTNAHCEPLTELVNVGLLGAVAYYGVWGSFLYRCSRLWREDMRLLSIALAICCYLFYNLLNFSQILNYPFAFALLAMGEAWMKQAEIRLQNEKTEQTNI